MHTTLRAVLIILAGGLLVEALGSLYLYLGGGYAFGVEGVILGLGPILALAGLLILYIGRRQWNVVAGRGVHAANIAFVLSLVALVAVLGLVGWFVYNGTSTMPAFDAAGLGLAVWASLVFTVATFALIAYDHAGTTGKVLLVLGVAWAAAVSAWIALILAQEMGLVLRTIELHSMSVGPVIAPVIPVEGYLTPAYFLLAIGYVEVILRLSLRPGKAPPERAPGPARSDSRTA